MIISIHIDDVEALHDPEIFWESVRIKLDSKQFYITLIQISNFPYVQCSNTKNTILFTYSG